MIGTVILSPETVMSILQPEVEERMETGATGGEGEVEAETGAKGAKKKKALPVYLNSHAIKMMEELQKLPNMIWIYNFLTDMEEKQKETGQEPSRELQEAIKVQ